MLQKRGKRSREGGIGIERSVLTALSPMNMLDFWPSQKQKKNKIPGKPKERGSASRRTLYLEGYKERHGEGGRGKGKGNGCTGVFPWGLPVRNFPATVFRLSE